MSLFNKLKKLKENPPSSQDRFYVDSVFDKLDHRIGVTAKGQPVFFIKTTPSKNHNIPISLNLIEIVFNQHCELVSTLKGKEEGEYTTVTLKTSSDDMSDYFLSSIYPLIKNLRAKPTAQSIKTELDKLVTLFKNLNNRPKNSVQGLWSEVFFIEQSKDLEYAINSWHVSKKDRYDFNDGHDKLEIKSTSSNQRIHRFNQAQLTKVKGVSVFVGSVFVLETNKGKTINDLLNTIKTKTKNQNLIYKLNLVISETLGRDIERIYETAYDYSFAASTKAFYNISDIPHISKENIPNEITNIKFDCNLEGVNQIDIAGTNSKLLKTF